MACIRSRSCRLQSQSSRIREPAAPVRPSVYRASYAESRGSGLGESAAEAFWASDAMRRVKTLIEQVANTNAPVLIEGESGVGKSLVAQALHTLSARRNHPFVKVNCAALPAALLESELFGYERGAFTGAHRRKPGKFEIAHGGTLVLDEIGEIPLALQAKLLHVLQDGRFARLGGARDIQVDVRVIGASNRGLAQAVEAGLFREDLYYRMNVVKIEVPPLRERQEEIPVLIDSFLRKYAEQYARPLRPVSGLTMVRLMSYPWPGNVRELENTVRRIILLGEESVLAGLGPAPEVPPAAPLQEGREAPLSLGRWDLRTAARRAAQEAERALIMQALEVQRWNKMAAARLLRISYRALLYKIRTYGLDGKAQDCRDQVVRDPLAGVSSSRGKAHPGDGLRG